MTKKARRAVWRKTTQRRRRAEERQRKTTMALQAAYHKGGTGAPSHERVDANKRKLRAIRDSVRKAEKALATLDRQIARAENPGQRAANALLGWVGRTENNNRASWLDAWAMKYVGRWMLGQPWCGLACIVAWSAAGVSLPKDTVSTVAILNRARRGDKFKSISPEQAKPGDLVVMDFSPSPPEAMHVGLALGPMRNGMIPTVEGNTSPGSGGSQNNGGGIYRRSRPRGVVRIVARPIT